MLALKSIEPAAIIDTREPTNGKLAVQVVTTSADRDSQPQDLRELEEKCYVLGYN